MAGSAYWCQHKRNRPRLLRGRFRRGKIGAAHLGVYPVQSGTVDQERNRTPLNAGDSPVRAALAPSPESPEKPPSQWRLSAPGTPREKPVKLHLGGCEACRAPHVAR